MVKKVLCILLTVMIFCFYCVSCSGTGSSSQGTSSISSTEKGIHHVNLEYPLRTHDELLYDTDCVQIVKGTIISKDTAEKIETDIGLPQPDISARTTFYVKVEQVIKGDVKINDTAKFWVIGGELSDRIIQNDLMPEVGTTDTFYIFSDGSIHPSGYVQK